MAKTKFSINKDTLLEAQGDGYILTRVPNSKMEYYLLFKEDEVLTEDQKTMIVEWDSDKELSILPWERGIRKPSLKEAIEGQQNPTALIKMKVSELYKKYYKYDKNKDPHQREKKHQEREAKRKESLARSGQEKKAKQQQTSNMVNDKADTKQSSEKKPDAQNPNEESLTPAQKVQQQQTPNMVNDKADTKQSSEKKPDAQNPNEESLTPAQKMQQQRSQIQRYTKEQFKEIQKGVRQHLNTSLYRNVNLSTRQMRELRLALKAGIDISKFNSPFISAKHMKELRVGAKKGVKLNLEKLDHSLYNADQIHELRLGFEKKLDMNRYLDPAYSAAQMRELRLGQQAGFDTKGYEDLHLTAAQMHSIRRQMVLDNIGEILKKMCEDIMAWLNEKIEYVVERLKARYQTREPMTSEQIKDARMEEAIADIKDVLVQSEILPESIYEDKEIDRKMKEQMEELVEYAQKNPEQSLNQPAKEAAMGVCTVAGAEMDNLKEEKVVSIRDNEETMNIEEAVEQAMQQAYEMDEMIEEETFEMMQ